MDVGDNPWTVVAGMAATLSVAVTALTARRKGRAGEGAEDADALADRLATVSERLAVLATRLDRAEHDIANDKAGRAAFAAALADLRVMTTRVDELVKDIGAIGAQQGRYGENLSRVHERVDELHRLVAARAHPMPAAE